MLRQLALGLTVLAATACGVRSAAPAPVAPASVPVDSQVEPASEGPSDVAAVPPADPGGGADADPAVDADGKVRLSDGQWRERLTPEQYRVLREKGTERAFTGEYWETKVDGTYVCAGCGLELFTSDNKYKSGCGWPSFYQAVADDVIDEHEDLTLGMRRVEVTCSRCGGHLGHVFEDGPQPTGLRYCINSVSILLQPKATGE